MKKYSYSLTKFSLLVTLAFVASCTKARKASLPDAEVVDIIAINEIPATQGSETKYKIQLDGNELQLSARESSRAENEMNRYPISDSIAPDKLKFMFKNLYVKSAAAKNYPITFSISPSYLTVYKVVDSLAGLDTIEKQFVLLKDEVILDGKLQKTESLSEKRDIAKKLQTLESQKTTFKKQNAPASYLVPIIQYKIEAYGILERIKNENNEETSVLRLKNTNWSQATHIRMSTITDKYLPIDLSDSDKKLYKNLFTIKSLQHKFMSAGELKNNYSVPNPLDDNAIIQTVLDQSGLNVFEFVQLSQLTPTQQSLLKSTQGLKGIYQCTKEEIETLRKIKAEFATSCYSIHRLIIPVNYVELEQPTVDNFGNKSSTISPNLYASFGSSAELIYIPTDVQYKRVEMDGLYDPNTYIKISDIKGKEFFMRRTLEDAPETTTFMPGEASPLTIVKFSLEDQALSVKRVELLTKNKTGVNSLDYEELMRLPVLYYRKLETDSKGNKLATPEYIRSNKDLAEYVVVDWTDNRLSSFDSPLSLHGRGQCLMQTVGMNIQDLEMALSKGVLNFSMEYSANLAATEECVGVYYPLNDYNPSSNFAQLTARVKERVSFIVNDGKTDVSYVKQVPFNVQNALGYGVWTIGKFNPSENGVRGREGQQIDLPVVHDFRNGKVLLYTVTGLPTDNAEKREIFRSSVTEIVKSWNKAYQQAFEGTPLARQGNYIEVQFDGENGVKAHLGDLNHNIIHFENKFNDNHGVLGVSQVGFNDRSGIVVADSLIIYAGNISKYVENVKRNTTTAQTYKSTLAKFKDSLKEKAIVSETEQEKSHESSTEIEAELESAASEFSPSEFGSRQMNQTMALKIQKYMKQKAGLKARKGVSIQNSRITQRIRSNTMAVKQKIASHLAESRKMTRSTPTNYTPNVDASFVQKAMTRTLALSNPSLVEIEGLVAEEMLKSMGNRLSAKSRMQLKRSAQLGTIRTRMKAQFESKPGCLLEPRESFNTRFQNQTFAEALKAEIFFTLSHEMGHSQGLTHNFIASFDKNNFAFSKDEKTTRNYSSVMDYIESSQMHWDGLGPYDVHAIRAAHTGLVEAHPFFIANNAKSAALINNKFISIDFIQNNLAKSGWASFSKYNVMSVVKEFKYCTDKDVGWEPVCLRFDFGTTAEEIVANQIEDYKENYINNYYAWDRLEFGESAKSNAISRMMNTMINIRPYMDELFYKAILEGASSPILLSAEAIDDKIAEAEIKRLQEEHQASIQDHIQAAVKSYLFYIGVIATPEATTRFMDLANRLVAVPYQYEKISGDKGEIKTLVKDIEVVEKKVIQDIAVTPDRLDTIGIEYDRLIALQMLTMKGYPSYKYLYRGLELSYMDFEKYVLGISEGERSIITNMLTSIFQDKMQPLFSNDNVALQPVPDTKAEVTSALRAYSGIFAIHGLESQTLKDKDNFANFFKVGSSVGQGPRDRINLTQLGVDKNSKTRLLYWAVDNAISANNLITSAARKYFFIDQEDKVTSVLTPFMEAHIATILDDGKDSEKSKKLEEALNVAKTTMATSLNLLNQANNGAIITNEEIQAGAPSIEQMADLVLQINMATIQAFQSGRKLESFIGDLDENFPLFDYSQKIFVSELTKKLNNPTVTDQLASTIDGGKTELKYGLIMKNLQFLNQLTIMINPEYNR